MEYSDEDILGAAEWTLLEINDKGLIKFKHTLDNVPKYLFILGTSAKALAAQIALKSRNYINMPDGSVSVNREGNISLYQQMYSQLREEFIYELDIYKGSQNIMRGL